MFFSLRILFPYEIQRRRQFFLPGQPLEVFPRLLSISQFWPDRSIGCERNWRFSFLDYRRRIDFRLNVPE